MALANHLAGVRVCPGAEVVALCDADPDVLERAGRESGVERLYPRAEDLWADEGVDAVIIATPNHVHREVAVAAARSGRHVLCEKPLALNLADALEMLEVAEASGVRHMTAFTYRFVPAMRYMKRLIDDGFIGRPQHFRAQRFQDWGRRHLGWRQVMATAGSGELGDMLSHRLDYAHYLVGPIARLVSQTKRLFETRMDAAGVEHASDVEDWVACLAEFEGGTATGVFESTKAAVGRGDGSFSRDWCEVNGTEGSLVYRLERPHQLDVARAADGPGLETVEVPAEFLKPFGSPRDVSKDDPLQGFRYDQDYEFLQAIGEGRPCTPSFHDGVRAQAVMDAILRSAREGCWVDVPRTPAPPR